jgi:hypothetical protein
MDPTDPLRIRNTATQVSLITLIKFLLRKFSKFNESILSIRYSFQENLFFFCLKYTHHVLLFKESFP